jgi:hypothetical protein
MELHGLQMGGVYNCDGEVCEVLVVFMAGRPLCSKLWKISSSLSRFSPKGGSELFTGAQ